MFEARPAPNSDPTKRRRNPSTADTGFRRACFVGALLFFGSLAAIETYETGVFLWTVPTARKHPAKRFESGP
jgi:hypothetical protein